MRSTCLMGIDIGAGSLKVMIVSSEGAVMGTASAELQTSAPQPGWSEQDPADWWRALCDAVPRALGEADMANHRIAAVAFSAGAHTPVLVDGSGKVIRPAILWSDARSGAEAIELQERHGDEILSVACNWPAATWTQPQLLWLARHEPATLERTQRLYVAKDWLRSQLTGTWETDSTEAAGTLLFDWRLGRWSERLCEMIGFDLRLLPPVVQPTTIVGEVTVAAAAQSGLAAGTPVVCGSSDTSVEIFGAGSARAGAGTIKLATAAAISIVTTQPQPDPGVINYPFCVPGYWYTIGATNSCASAHRWLRDCLFADRTLTGAQAFDLMDRQASVIAPGANGLLFHPYLQGERTPHWDPLLRGSFIGLTFAHDRRHFVRALYEGVAFSLRDVLGVLRSRRLDMSEARIIGGGARSATWRQIVADVLSIPVVKPREIDASFGAALIAGVGIGVFPDETSAIDQAVSVVARHEPDPSKRALYEDLHGIFRDAASQLAGISHRLAGLRAIRG